MPSLHEFILNFGWKELTISLLMTAAIVVAREQGWLFRSRSKRKPR